MTTTTPSSETDRIERSIVINAPRPRVWRALSNAEEFGGWFGVDLKGKSFSPGQRVQGPITIKGYEHIMFDVVVERVSIGDRINELVDRLQGGGGSFRFDSCFDLTLAAPELRHQVVVTLLAVP